MSGGADVGGRIVVGGEALVDLVPVEGGEGGELAPLAPRLGGGPFTTAVGLGRLGVPTSMLTRLSTDAFGDALAARLADNGVDTALVARGAEPTTLAVVTLGEDGQARYSFHVAGSADRFVADPGALPPDTVALAVGTLGLVLEPGAGRYAALAAREAAAGRFVSLDPNVRSALVDDAGALRSRLDGLAAVAGLVKLSDEDAEWWGRSPADLLDLGAAAVVLTRGGEGLSAVTAAGRVDVPADRARPVVDTIGAGDSVHAALLGALYADARLDRDRIAALDTDGWRRVLARAATAASLTCSRAGAEPPSADELDAAAEGPAGAVDPSGR